MHLQRWRGGSLAWAAPLIVLTMILPACGGSSKTTAAASPSTTAAGSSSTAARSTSAFTSCMTGHGIPASALKGFGRRRAAAGATGSSGGSTPPSLPTPSLPAGVTQQQFQAALSACRADLPAGRGLGLFGNSAQAAAYRNCLRLNGVTLPASPASGSATSTPPVTIDRSSPTYTAAVKACAALRPSRSSTTSTTS